MVEVTGEITDELGRPLSDMDIRFEGVSSLATHFEYATTDSHGLYSVSLYPGTYDVQVETRVGFGYPLWTGKSTFDASHPRLSIVIPSSRVTGTVKDPTGALLDSGYVYAVGEAESEYFYTSRRFDSGSFEIVVPHGTYRFGVSFLTDRGFPSTRTGDVSVHADTTLLLEIVGEPLAGIVFGRGGPLARARIVADGGDAFCTALADDGGNYLMYLPPRTYRFTIRPAESWIQGKVTTLQPISGPSTLDFDLDGALWSGTVQEQGAPAPGLIVSAWMFADDFDRGAVDTTDAAGGFQLLLEPGREFSLQVRRPDANELEYYHPGIVANADTTFQIVIDPPAVP